MTTKTDLNIGIKSIHGDIVVENLSLSFYKKVVDLSNLLMDVDDKYESVLDLEINDDFLSGPWIKKNIRGIYFF